MEVIPNGISVLVLLVVLALSQAAEKSIKRSLHDEAPLQAAPRRPWPVRPVIMEAGAHWPRGKKSGECVYRWCRGLTGVDFLQCTRHCSLGDDDGHDDGQMDKMTGHGAAAEMMARQQRRQRRSVPDSREQHAEEQAWDTARAGDKEAVTGGGQKKWVDNTNYGYHWGVRDVGEKKMRTGSLRKRWIDSSNFGKRVAEETNPEEHGKTAHTHSKRWIDTSNFGKRWIDSSNFGKRWIDSSNFGKRWVDASNFGKRSVDDSYFGEKAQHEDAEDTKAVANKKWIDSSNFGKRWIDSSNFGKRWIDSSNFGKRWIDNSNFGKRSLESSSRDKKWIDSSNFGKRWIDSSNFGKRSAETSSLDKKWIDNSHFGKRWIDSSNFGKRWVDSSNFGKRSTQDLDEKNWIATSNFGKRWIDSSNFGKRSAQAMDKKWVDNTFFDKKWIDDSNFGKRWIDSAHFDKKWDEDEEKARNTGDHATPTDNQEAAKSKWTSSTAGEFVEEQSKSGETRRLKKWIDATTLNFDGAQSGEEKSVEKKWVDEMNYGKRWRMASPLSSYEERLLDISDDDAAAAKPRSAANEYEKRWIDPLAFSNPKQPAGEPHKRFFFNPLNRCLRNCKLLDEKEAKNPKFTECLSRCIFNTKTQ